MDATRISFEQGTVGVGPSFPFCSPCVKGPQARRFTGLVWRYKEMIRTQEWNIPRIGLRIEMEHFGAIEWSCLESW
jgi:hypothetical protein